MDVMKTFPDGHFDLAIVDPPYGIGRSKGIGKRKGECVFTEYTDKKWDSAPPPPEYWSELERVAANRIVWGANYFGYPFERMIVWDKQIGDNDFSMAEIASHTFKTPTKVVTMFCGANRNGRDTTRIHPTQKPVKLYTWILDRFAKPGMRVLDTHMGSGSIAIAAHYAGIHLTACEIDADYYEAAKVRIARETSQTELFSPHNAEAIRGATVAAAGATNHTPTNDH
jgi:site-specific DNA-methyltransferase (adenine-specific)